MKSCVRSHGNTSSPSHARALLVGAANSPPKGAVGAGGEGAPAQQQMALFFPLQPAKKTPSDGKEFSPRNDKQKSAVPRSAFALGLRFHLSMLLRR